MATDTFGTSVYALGESGTGCVGITALCSLWLGGRGPFDAPVKRHRHWHPSTTRHRTQSAVLFTEADASSAKCTRFLPFPHDGTASGDRSFSRTPLHIWAVRRRGSACQFNSIATQVLLVGHETRPLPGGSLATRFSLVDGAAFSALTSSSFSAPLPTFVPASILATGAL